MSQQERRTTPSAWTWELPAAALLAALGVGGLAAQLARSLAVWTSGQGWVWPAPRTLYSSLPGIFTGDASAGLAHQVAQVAGLQGWLITTETGALLLLGWAAAWILRRYGPHRLRGMASTSEAEQHLGQRRLRRLRHIIRPDLYPTTVRHLADPIRGLRGGQRNAPQ